MNTLEPDRPRRGRRSAWALVFAVVLAGCGGGGGPDPANANWVVLGSSSAAGTGAPAGQGWVARLAQSAASQGVAVYNHALAGALTYQALPAITPRAEGRPATLAALDIGNALASAPELVILAFPSNDAMAGYPAAETVANLLAIEAVAALRGAAVMVLSSQPRADASAAQRATMRAVDAAMASALGACFVGVRNLLDDGQGHIASAYAAADGVHLNAEGHAVVYRAVAAVIDSRSCRPTRR